VVGVAARSMPLASPTKCACNWRTLIIIASFAQSAAPEPTLAPSLSLVRARQVACV
jgi:hypothetical protein